jgi:hypothetical protein
MPENVISKPREFTSLASRFLINSASETPLGLAPGGSNSISNTESTSRKPKYYIEK